MLKYLKSLLTRTSVQDQRDTIVTLAFELEERLQVCTPLIIDVPRHRLKLAYVHAIMGVI